MRITERKAKAKGKRKPKCFKIDLEKKKIRGREVLVKQFRAKTTSQKTIKVRNTAFLSDYLAFLHLKRSHVMLTAEEES